VSGNSRGKRLSERVDRRQVLLYTLVLSAGAVTWFLPWNGLGWVWYVCAVLVYVICGWGYGVREDWRKMYHLSFDFSDETAKMAPPDARCYSVAVMKRAAPPRLIWTVVVNDHGSRVYMGWFLWSRRSPEWRKAVSRGIRRRQVA
jgi:hypothetical protein